MKHPPHVQSLLDSLSPEQALFQRRCIGFVLGLQVLVGMLLAFFGGGSLVDLYFFKHWQAAQIYQMLENDIGVLAMFIYPAACIACFFAGWRLMSA